MIGGEDEIVGEFASIPGFCFFHLVRRFWNQILTCVSVSLSDNAKFNRSQTDKYRVVLNLFSSETNCSYVKAVLALLGLPDLPSLPLLELLLDDFLLLFLEHLILSCTFSSVVALTAPRFFDSDVDDVIGDPPEESGSTCL